MPLAATVSTPRVQVFAADRSGYIGFGVILGTATSFAVVVLWHERSIDTVLLLLTCISVSCLTFYWLRAFRITIGTDTLTYSSMMEMRTVPLTAIRTISFGYKLFEKPFGPTVQLILTLGNESPPVIINAKVFSREAIAAVRCLVPSGVKRQD
jgi:hypothetical protein